MKNNNLGEKRVSNKVWLNFVYNSMYQVFNIFIPLITIPYITRTLGASGVGRYSYVISVVTYFSLFVKLGLNNYGSREIAFVREDKRKLSETFWNIYFFQLVMSVLVIGGYFIFLEIYTTKTIEEIIAVIYIISSGIDITWFFWGMEEFKLTVKRDFFVKVFSTVSIFCLVKDGNDTWKYICIMCLSSFISQCLCWFKLFNYIKWKKPNCIDICRHIKPNLVLFIPSMAISIYKTMDKIMLGTLSSVSEVGLYQSAETIISVPMALINSLGTVVQPHISNLISNKVKEVELKNFFAKTISISTFISTTISFGIMVVAKEFIPIFLGAEFKKCILLLYILLPSCIFLAFANVIRTQYLIPRKKDKEYIISLFVGAIVNVIINLVLIPKFQSCGAAIGTLFAEMAVCFVQIYYVRRDVPVLRYLLSVVPYIVAGIIMVMITTRVVVANNAILLLFIKILVGGSVYCCVLLVLILLKKTIGIRK